MKTTLDLPDELMREVKVLAAKSDRKLKDLLAELLRKGLTKSRKAPVVSIQNRVSLPLVACGEPGAIDLTSEQIDQLLLAQELAAANEPV
ncbi:MAG: antitoxin [Verrucomicrobia bacterium]|nr:antitoxin [Verrucomicrobiota bacterium]